MPLKDGDPADGWDIWLRNITNKDHLRKDGTLKNNAFLGGKRPPIAPPLLARLWDHELSGRLLSLTVDFEAEGRAFCKNLGLSFQGVMYAPVEMLCHQDNEITTDVHYTPIQDGDQAHADLTMVGTNDSNLFRVRDWLQDTVQVALQNNCFVASPYPKKT
jgi:hypothetical protein